MQPELDERAELGSIPILVVDDVADNLALMEALLGGEGFADVLLAERGQLALDMLERRPDVGVVLLDLMMPDMDGYEVCRRITTNPATAHIPVIVVTGAAFRQNEALLSSFAAGAVDFIHKPLNEIELVGRLRVALALYRERVLRQASIRRIASDEARFRLILDQAPVGIAQIDAGGRILLVNRSLCDLLGHARDRLEGTSLWSLAADPQLEQQVQGRVHEAPAAPAHGLLETRLLTADGSTVWVSLSVARVEDASDGSMVVTLEDITERRETADRMREMVFYDALTQLPNRMLFNNELERAIELARQHRHHAAVLFLDLDNFKNINDSLGHVIGDRLLQSVARRVSGCIRANDVFARFGGDEFTLLLPQIHEVEDACRVARKILDQFESTIQVDEHDFYVSTSIGISFFPQDGEAVDTLIKNADTAMYRAKDLGRRNYQLFNPAMDARVQQRLDLEQELRRALEQGDFRLYFQPQVSLRDMRIVGMEALLRWVHPRRGMLTPSAFLPLAEETGLIIALGDWVLDEACRQARRWRDQGHAGLVTYVNLSRRQFQQQDLVGKIRGLLAARELPPTCLGIEITESVNSLDTDAVIANLRSFRELGIRTALDDFGVGFSSLNNLKHFPLNALKIDKSFIEDALHNEDDLAIVQTIIALGRSFGLEVIAEGVESAETLELLRSLGCDGAQGHHFSQPRPADELLDMLAGRPLARQTGAA